jgi:hypothetical protein
MNLRERMLEAISKNLNEGVESSKEIMSNNIVPSFEEMGMANVEPGEFAQGEITDQENLVNKANMSNDNDFGKSSDTGNSFEKAVEDMANDLVDISAGDNEDSDVTSLKIVKTTDDCCDCEENKHSFGESHLAKFVESILNGKTCEQYLAEKTNYNFKPINPALSQANFEAYVMDELLASMSEEDKQDFVIECEKEMNGDPEADPYLILANYGKIDDMLAYNITPSELYWHMASKNQLQREAVAEKTKYNLKPINPALGLANFEARVMDNFLASMSEEDKHAFVVEAEKEMNGDPEADPYLILTKYGEIDELLDYNITPSELYWHMASKNQLQREAVKESNYAGPLNFVPDVRISVADVVAALKNKIGEGSEAVHVDQEYDERKDNAYKVSQIDKNLLPKKLHVENVLLELDGDTYKVNKTSDAFPLAR